MRESIHRSGDEQLGLHLGESIGRDHGGHLLTCLMLNCANLGEALALQCRYHDIVDNQGALLLTCEGELARLTWRMHSGQASFEGLERDFEFQLADWIIAALTALIRELSAGGAVIREIRLIRPAPKDASEYRRVIGETIRFSAESDEILLESSALSIPVALADPELLKTLTSHAESTLRRVGARESWTQRVSVQLAQMIRASTPSLPEVARALGTSARTLQTRLLGEQTSFTRILDDSRRLLALEQLQSRETSLGEIAFMLDFSDQSALTRACKRWTGMSPSDYRGKHSRP